MIFHKKIFFILLALVVSFACRSQIVVDTATTQSTHSPKRAAIYSAVLPGLGQIYNKKYWKLPIVYVGVGGFTYLMIHSNNQFKTYKNTYLNSPNNDPNRQAYLNEMERWDGYKQLCIVGLAVFYALQIIDANVDAHLFDFDVSDNLSVKFHPRQFSAELSPRPVLGIGCTIKF